MRLADAEDLWLACVMQTPAYADHSIVTDDQLSPRGRLILEGIRTVHKQGWPHVLPDQIEGVDLRTIPRRMESIDAKTTLPAAEKALLDAWANARCYESLLAAADVCTTRGRDAAIVCFFDALQVLQSRSSALHWKRPADVAREVLARIRRALQESGPLQGIGSGLSAVDIACRFYPPARLTTIGGTTGAGKSTLALSLLTGMAIQGHPTAMISLEDEVTIMAKRQVAMVTQQAEAVRRFLADEATPADLDLLDLIVDTALEVPMEILHLPGGSSEQVCHAVHDAARRGAQVVGVDYLQCFDTDPREKRSVGLARAARQVKAAGAQVGVHTMLVSQLRRPQDGNLRSRPTMTMFKETGDIENITEYALLVWRPERGKNVDVETAHVIVDKAKDGAPGIIDLGWDTSRSLFTVEPPSEAATGQRPIDAGYVIG